MQKTKIDWGIPNLYTWNPVTGCRRGCSYCYARRIHERFEEGPFNELRFHRERIFDVLPQKPSTIFIGSMSDIEYWKIGWVEDVLQTVELWPDHTFMFLSKNSDSYKNYFWPRNTMQGLTITKLNNDSELINLGKISKLPRPYLSIEPLLGMVLPTLQIKFMARVIVGAMTGPKAIIPTPAWIQSIKNNVPESIIYWKPNIRKYL